MGDQDGGRNCGGGEWKSERRVEGTVPSSQTSHPRRAQKKIPSPPPPPGPTSRYSVIFLWRNTRLSASRFFSTYRGGACINVVAAEAPDRRLDAPSTLWPSGSPESPGAPAASRPRCRLKRFCGRRVRAKKIRNRV